MIPEELKRYTDLNARKLIELKAKGKIVFVGDTHGDVEATKAVFERYHQGATKIVFLGDYVDRGAHSKENADLIIATHKQYPEQVIPLQGNHEGYHGASYTPAEFWAYLDDEETFHYLYSFSQFPLAVSVGNILALHGGIPNFLSLSRFEKIRYGDQEWETILWGDFSTEQFPSFIPGRPKFTRAYFERTMSALGKSLLIRGHDPTSRMSIYDGRCVTLSTSEVYNDFRKRNVAIADFDKREEIKTIDDLIIEEI